MNEQYARPQTLKAATDYYPALLWLMGEMGQARTSDALAEFDRRLGDLIPPEHREANPSGNIKWEHYVRWGRQALVKAGLMGSGGWGIWTITEVGRQWLQEHQDGSGRELVALIQKREPVAGLERQAIQLGGETFHLSKDEVLATIHQALANGVPSEASRFKNWSLEVDGVRVSIKWVMSLITGLPTIRFKTGDAHRQLSKLGLEPQSLEQIETLDRPRDGDPSPATEMTRQAFFEAVLLRMEDQLPEGIESRRINPNMNYFQLTCPAPGSHYELRLLKRYTEIAIHFEGRRELNLALLEQFRPQAETLGKKLKEPVHAEPWGSNSARVYLKRQPSRLDVPTAKALADAWLRFIEVTHPEIEQAIVNLELPVPSEFHELTRQAFYQTVLAHLEGKLPEGIKGQQVNPNAYCLQLSCPAPSSHYELRLLKKYTEIAIHFEGPRDRNVALLDQFRPHVKSLKAKLQEPIYAEPWGQNWAKVYLKRPPARLDVATAQDLAGVWLSFVVATLPVIERAIIDLGLPIPSELHELTREAFFRTVLAHLQGKLPTGIESRQVSSDAYCLQLSCPAPSTHYELRFLKNYTEIAIHFEGPRERNLALLDQFQPHAEALTKQINEPVRVEPWGKHWARVYISRPPVLLDASMAEALATALISFIGATLPIVDKAVADLGLRIAPGRPSVRMEEKELST